MSIPVHTFAHMRTHMNMLTYKYTHTHAHIYTLVDDDLLKENKVEKDNYFRNVVDDITTILKNSRQDNFVETEALKSKLNTYFAGMVKKEEEVGLLHYRLMTQKKVKLFTVKF